MRSHRELSVELEDTDIHNLMVTEHQHVSRVSLHCPGYLGRTGDGFAIQFPPSALPKLSELVQALGRFSQRDKPLPGGECPPGPWFTTGPYYREDSHAKPPWYEVTNGDVQIARCDTEPDADRIAAALNAERTVSHGVAQAEAEAASKGGDA